MTILKGSILQLNQYMKSNKMLYIIYADLESLEKTSTSKIGEHISCGYSMSTTWEFDNLESEHIYIAGKIV